MIQILDGNHDVVCNYYYDAWGAIRLITDADGNNITDSTNQYSIAYINPIRYRGYYYDVETGFYYLQTRYYDPEIGRFISRDSYENIGANGDVGSYNLFAYCSNNPIGRVDPTGEFSIWDALDIVSAVNSWSTFVSNPSLGNFASAALDTIGLLPIIPSIGTAKTALGIIDDGIDALKIVDDASDALKIADDASDVAKLAEAGEDVVECAKRLSNVTKQNSPIFKSFTPVKGSPYKTSGSGRNKRYFDWDYTHNDIEIYDKNGNHLGSLDPVTGELYKPAVPGRKLKK